MVIEDLIHPDDKAAIMRALLLRHRHVNDHSHGSFHFGSRSRKYSSYSSLQVKFELFIVFITSIQSINFIQYSTKESKSSNPENNVNNT
jgi:hypothetical protein